MSWWSDLRHRAVALVRGARLDRELDDEMRFHMDMQAAHFEQRGLTPEDARRRSVLAFGGAGRTREEVQEARGVRWIENLLRDTQFSLRQLARAPGFTFLAVTTLALGIGASTAIFSVIDGVLLRPISLERPDQLVVVWETDRRSGTTREPTSWPDYLDLRERAHTLSASAALVGAEVVLSPADGAPARLTAVLATASYFALVGVRPIMGRTFTEDEARPGGRRVVLLGEVAWRARFGADPDIIGRSLRVDDSLYTVVGVLPAGADFGVDQIHARAAYHGAYTTAGSVDLWLPLQASATSFPRDTHPFFVVARLGAAVTLARAQDELTTIAGDLERAYPSNTARGIHLEALETVTFGPTRPLLYLLLCAVALLLLAAMVNVANLLLARGTTRLREAALRGALGASFARVGQQFFVESVMLALLGAVAGIGLAYAGLRGFLALAPRDIPRIEEVGLDARVLALALVASLGVGLAFGCVPVLQARKVDLIRTLRGDATSTSADRSRRRVREGLVLVELALSVTLAVSAVLLIRSFRTVMQVDPGFEAQSVVKAQFQLPTARYPNDFAKWPNWPEIHRFNATLLERVRAIPGVTGAALAAAHPLDAGFTNSFQVVGREAESRDWPEISMRIVSPGYFPALGVRLARGRLIDASDDAAAPAVVLINEAAVRRFFPDRDPVGQQLRFWGSPHRIVGTVGNERIHGVTEQAPPAAYTPLAQAPSNSGVLLVRTSATFASMGPAVRQAISETDDQLAVYGLEPLSDTLVRSEGERRFAMMVLAAFGLVTTLIALVGIHGVVSYTTAQRTREIGIRLALGATSHSVITTIVRGALGIAALGALAGLAGAAAVSRLLTGLLFGVTGLDPATFVLVPVGVLLATALSAYMPARRATHVAPLQAIRSD